MKSFGRSFPTAESINLRLDLINIGNIIIDKVLLYYYNNLPGGYKFIKELNWLSTSGGLGCS